MRFPSRFALAAVVAVAALLLSSPPSTGAAPVTNFAGTFEGRLTAKGNAVGGAAPIFRKAAMLLILSQEQGPDLSGTLSIARTGQEGPLLFTVTGRAASGKFWLEGVSAEGRLLAGGAAKGTSTKRSLLAEGVFAGTGQWTAFKLKFKEKRAQ